MNTKAVADHISGWLKNYAEISGAKGFVVGVSGGIDSAVTSSLCAKSGLPTLCLEMPIHQADSQLNRAAKHIAKLKTQHACVSSEWIELTDIFDSFVNALPEVTNKAKHDFSLVNTRARFRMSTLYYFAALKGYLVAGTGNKVEDFGVGFYTKYGDGGVDLSPIADLMKTEVYALGKELGVIEDIMVAPPTDGLWGDDRTDEDQIGATYPELEWAMEYHGDPEALEGRQKEVFEIYSDYNRRNKHKMVPIPVCEIPDELKS
ncbi:MAG: NAD(+) synthase [Flavobacteriales bacterium]|nr:NAD(+) synthase [Flavobacteriales bacterium]